MIWGMPANVFYLWLNLGIAAFAVILLVAILWDRWDN